MQDAESKTPRYDDTDLDGKEYFSERKVLLSLTLVPWHALAMSSQSIWYGLPHVKPY